MSVHGDVYQINDRCEIIGSFSDSTGRRLGGLWQNGQIVDLDEKIKGSGFTNFSPYAINNKGVILAAATKVNTGESMAVLLLPIGMKVVNRDDPKKKWADAKDWSVDKPLYAGKSTGDMVSWKFVGADSLANATFSWRVQGPETIIGPSGVGKSEWRIADGDDDTFHDWVDWKPGQYGIKCTVDFGGGNSATAEFTQEVGVRTDDVTVIGWIDPAQVSLSGSGVQVVLTRVLPLGGFSSSDEDFLKVRGGILLRYVTDSALNTSFNPVPWGLRDYISLTLNAFSQADKKYTLNWMFKYGGNPAPPDSFTDDDGFFSQQKLDDFTTKQNKTLYKLLNHYQARYLVDQNQKFKAGTLVHMVKAAKIGSTLDPTRLYELGGVVVRNVAVLLEGYPPSGAFPGQPASNNTEKPVASDTITRLDNEGTPDQRGLNAEKNLTGQDQGHIWSSVAFFSDLQYCSETTSPATSQLLTRDPTPTEPSQGRINTQVYPTYWIYINGKKTKIQNQAPDPSALFPNTDIAQ